FSDKLKGGGSFSNSEKYTGGAGNDTIDGRGGWDELVYSYEVTVGSRNGAGEWIHGDRGVDVDLGAGTAQDAFGDTDTLISIEEVAGTKFKDKIKGDGKANTLRGLEGADKLEGG